MTKQDDHGFKNSLGDIAILHLKKSNIPHICGLGKMFNSGLACVTALVLH
jgi:hypothetical protein